MVRIGFGEFHNFIFVYLTQGRKEFCSPNAIRDVYYPLLHQDGRSSIQMVSVMDMNNNILISDEIVVRNHAYRLDKFRQYFDLQSKGRLYATKITSFTKFIVIHDN